MPLRSSSIAYVGRRNGPTSSARSTSGSSASRFDAGGNAESPRDPEEFRDLGNQVVVLGTAFARGRQSGVAVEQQGAWSAEVRDGQSVRFRSFSDQREALEAAGMQEQGGDAPGFSSGSGGPGPLG